MSLYSDLVEVLTPYANKIKRLVASDDQIKADLEESVSDLKSAILYNAKAIDKSMEFALISPVTSTGGWKITSNGNPTQDALYQIDKYAVTAGDLLRLKLSKDGDVVYTFSEDSSVSSSKLVGLPETSAVDKYVVVPTSATYMMVSRLKTNNVDSVESCTSIAVNHSALIADINSEINNVESVMYDNLIDAVEPINLYNKNADGIITGYYLGPSITEGSQYSISDYIPVVNGKTYSWYSDANSLLCFYNSSNEYLGFVRGTSISDKIYNATINNSNCAFVRFSYKTATKDIIMFAEGSEYPETYHDYISESYYRVKGDIDTNPLYGKKVGVIGDSIMYGEGYQDGAIGIIASKNSMALSNKAVSGAKITITGSTASIYNQLALLDADCDYIIFDGGVNDMLDDNLGVITTGFNATYDEATFSGSFEKLVHDIVATFPTKKIGYVSVHRLKQWEGDSYSSYANTGYYTRAMEILAKWGIPVCDLTKGTLSLYENSALKSLYTKNGDGWHPNESGYKLFYVDKIESWMKTL